MASHAAPRRHIVTVSSMHFEVDSCYVPYKLVGKGAYGLVAAARADPSVLPLDDSDGGEADTEVAIKKIANIFSRDVNIIEAKRTLREIHLLRQMRHENVLCVLDVLVPSDPHNFTDAYVVAEKMDSDMHRIIQSNQRLSDDHTRFFIYQLLRGLKYLHSAGVIHRDLKPGNLLLNANCDLKISDFGLARTVDPEAEAALTQYVVTRWYRAPELLLMSPSYTAAVDMWSAGCIMAELIGRKPLFPGRTHLHQLQLIVARLGAPSREEAQGGVPAKLAEAIDKAMSTAVPPADAQPQPLAELLPGISEDALDLLHRLLRFDPNRRASAEEALSHPYLADLHEESAEPCADCLLTVDFESDTAQGLGHLRRIYVDVAEASLAEREERVRAYHAARAAGSAGTPTASTAGTTPVAEPVAARKDSSLGKRMRD